MEQVNNRPRLLSKVLVLTVFPRTFKEQTHPVGGSFETWLVLLGLAAVVAWGRLARTRTAALGVE